MVLKRSCKQVAGQLTSVARYTGHVPDLPLEISIAAVHERLRTGASLFLIDIREPNEHAIARIAAAGLIPMGQVPTNVQVFKDRDEPVVVFCHHGVRSLHVAAWLREQGVGNVQSMSGGIDAWSLVIDPLVPRY